MQKLKKAISILLVSIIVLMIYQSSALAYSPPRADRYDFAVTDIKVISSPPYREENSFKVGVTVNYSATNYGYLEEQPDRWVECSKCHGNGYITVGGTETCPTCSGKGKETKTVLCYCSIGTAPHDKPNAERGSHKCRPQCDGWDYLCDSCGKAYSNNFGGYQYCKCGGTVKRDHICDCVFNEIKTYICPTCNGSGKIGENAHDVECPSCHGECGKFVPVPPVWVPPTRPSEGHTQLSFTIDGLNQDYALLDITVPIEGESVDLSRNGSGWSVWGSAYYEIELNAGENIGKKNVEARINWENKSRETNPNNNTQSTQIDVIPATNLTVEMVEPNAYYRTDKEAITTYIIHNKDDIGELNIRPKHKLTAEFKAVNPSTGAVVDTATRTDIVIPKKGSNIVYFKWHVPKDYKEDDIKLQCNINTSKVQGSVGVPGVNEMDYTDNTAVGTNAVKSGAVMETPDTVFENAPNGFIKPIGNETVPFERISKDIMDKSSWEVWEWDIKTDWYIKNTYGLEIKTTQEILPDVNSLSHEFIKSKDMWQIRSGYGFSLNATSIINSNGYLMPLVNDYTIPQSANAYFPEYRYVGDYKKHRTLERTSNTTFAFERNPNAKNDKGKQDFRRIHFIPLWYPDGEYKVKTYLYDCWTPGGMIGIENDIKPMLINGDMYDDWYVNHSEK